MSVFFTLCPSTINNALEALRPQMMQMSDDQLREKTEEFKKRYRAGTVGDVEVKASLIEAMNQFLEPIRTKRKEIEKEKGYVESVLYHGTMAMADKAQDTLKEMKSIMGLSGTWNKISRLAREYQEKHRDTFV